MEFIRLAATGSWIVGGTMAALALVWLLSSVRDPAARLASLGVVYLGMFVIAGGVELYLLAPIGENRLPLVAGLLSPD